MGCYQCGSRQGDISRLCPKCNETRLRQRRHGSGSGLNQTFEVPTATILSPLFILQLVGVLLIGIGGIYFVLFSHHGPGLALSPADKIVAKCRRKMDIDTMKSEMRSKAKANRMAKNGKVIPKDLEKAMVSLWGGLTESMCEAFAHECRQNPTGSACKKSLEFFQ